MTIAFEPVTLDVDSGDHSAMLIFHDRALIAVASMLGSLHGELQGSWFVEIVFRGNVASPREPFPDLVALESWLTARLP